MNNIINLRNLLILGLITILSTLTYMYGPTLPTRYVESNDDVIIVVKHDSSSASVSLGYNTLYVEVEYPDTDYTLEQELDYEIQYAIRELQQLDKIQGEH